VGGMARKDCWRAIVVCLVLGLGTIALYSPAFAFHFVNYEDQVYVTANPHVNHGLHAEGLRWAFQTFYTGNWQPLTWLSHMVDCQIYGPKAGGHHATNVALHALSAVILFLALSRMTGGFWRSAAVAAFFAWHPLQVESVAWIAERKEVLSGLFWLLALGSYVHYAQNFKSKTNFKLFYALAVVFFALGLMVRPMLVMLPCILLLIDWWPLGRLRFSAAPAEEKTAPAAPGIAFVLIEKIPFVLLSIASCIVAVRAGGHEVVPSLMGRMSFNHRLVTVGLSYFRYLEKIVWPSDLGSLYPIVFHLPKVELAAIALFLLGVTALALRLRKSRPYWLTGWLWFLAMLVPTLNLFHTNAQPMADRYMYLSSIGLFILICWEAADLASQWPAGRIVLGILCGLALAGCCVASSFQLQYWKNEGALLSRIAEPRLNYFGHANYASYLMAHNQLTEAQVEAETAAGILPDYAPFKALLGDIFFLEHKYDDAIEQFRLTQKLDPRLVGIHLLWGRALLAEKRVDAATSEFKTVINADPKNFEAHNLLGKTYMVLGKTSAAIEEFRASLALQPKQPELLNDLAWMLATNPNADLRNGVEAVKLAGQGCGLTHSTQPVLLGTLAAAYAEAGRFDDAVATAQQAHDVASARASAAEKANEPAAARAEQALAARNLELLELYRSHKPFHEKAAKP
jgi:tetratricopeptide (TPR) repeat protein